MAFVEPVVLRPKPPIASEIKYKGTLLGTPNRVLYSWGSLFGVPCRVPLKYYFLKIQESRSLCA